MVGFRRRTLKLDSFIILMLEKYGHSVLVFGVLVYLAVEGFLDIATDILSHKIIKRMDREPD